MKNQINVVITELLKVIQIQILLLRGAFKCFNYVSNSQIPV